MVIAAQLLGHDAALGAVRGLVMHQTLAHVLLVTGADGVGKTTFALTVASDLVCIDPSEDGAACGECRSCTLAAAGTHPDITRVAPLREETTIGQMRDLRYSASLVPAIAARRIVIIERAETLNDQAANAILKLLEDAPDRVVIIMLSPSPEGVLATIRSRSVQIPLRPVSQQELAAFLVDSGVGQEEAPSLAAYAGGAPGRALTLSREPELMALLGDVDDWMRRLAEAPPGAALKLAEDLRALGKRAKKHIGGDEASERQAMAWVLDAVMAAIQTGIYAGDTQQTSASAASLSARWSAGALGRMATETNNTRRLILSYAQADLQTDRLVMRLLAEG